MAFVKKTWKDRIVQYANRRLLTKSGGEVEQVTVTRDEGTISEAGDQFNASNMNDLENRVKTAFDDVDDKFAYSTTERAIGKWIDNKTLYEKVISIPSVVMDSSWHNTAHNIANIDKVVYIYGIMTNNNYEFIPVPNIRPAQTLDNLPVGIELNADKTNVRYMNNWLSNIIEFYVIMRYTKTS